MLKYAIERYKIKFFNFLRKENIYVAGVLIVSQALVLIVTQAGVLIVTRAGVLIVTRALVLIVSPVMVIQNVTTALIPHSFLFIYKKRYFPCINVLPVFKKI